MNRLYLNDRFADMWRKSREDAGKSQEYMAKSLGVSKKTIQNWESGLSSPSQVKGFEWFVALGLQPLPYYLSLLYDDFEDMNGENDTDEQIDAALISIVRALPSGSKRKLLYMLFGDHGSSPSGIIEMVTAHLQTPLRDRINIAQNIITNYELANAHGNIVNTNHIQPDIALLRQALINGFESVKGGKQSYTLFEDEKK